MKIGFKPQNLVQNLVLEKFSKNGDMLKRIIEIPGKSPKTLEINYEKTKFVPTEWYVSNYNVISRNGKSSLVKTLESKKTLPNEQHTVVKRFNEKHQPEKLVIDVANGKVHKTKRHIKQITRTGV